MQSGTNPGDSPDGEAVRLLPTESRHGEAVRLTPRESRDGEAVRLLPRESRSDSPQPLFLYDLGDPLCYLAAEFVMSALPVVPEWEPVHGASVGLAPEAPDLMRLGTEIAEAGLQPLRWPAGWPPDTERVMLAASYAKAVGRAVAFSLAAFRQAFAGGRDLADEATILIAAAACEMHPAALLKGMTLRSARDALAHAGERAAQLGVRRLPAILVGSEVFQGPGAIEQAAERLGALR